MEFLRISHLVKYVRIGRDIGLELPTLSHGNSYIFYEVANSYDLTRTI